MHEDGGNDDAHRAKCIGQNVQEDTAHDLRIGIGRRLMREVDVMVMIVVIVAVAVVILLVMVAIVAVRMTMAAE